MVSGLAAAHLHGITSTHPREVLVVAPVRRESFTLDHWVVQFRRGLRRGMGEPRRAWLEEALLDMAGEVSEIDVVGALTRGLAQGLTSPERFLAALQERPKLRHVAVLRDLCTYGRDVESVLEWLFDQNVIRRHGLPVPTNQVRRVAGTDTSASGAVHVLQSHFSLGQRVQSDSGT